MRKHMLAGLVALAIVMLGAPAYAVCPAAGALTIPVIDGLVGQVWIQAGASFSVSPMLNGSSVWFARQDGSADTLVILINRSGGTVIPHIRVADFEGLSMAEADIEIASEATLTLSVSTAVAAFCESRLAPAPERHPRSRSRSE